MKSKRRKEDVLNEFRRSELITSARRVFGAHGFANATMEAIARDADVAKGTVYLYYDSKRAIYEAAWRASMEELDALVKAQGRVGRLLASRDRGVRRSAGAVLLRAAGLLPDVCRRDRRPGRRAQGPAHAVRHDDRSADPDHREAWSRPRSARGEIRPVIPPPPRSRCST